MALLPHKEGLANSQPLLLVVASHSLPQHPVRLTACTPTCHRRWQVGVPSVQRPLLPQPLQLRSARS